MIALDVVYLKKKLYMWLTINPSPRSQCQGVDKEQGPCLHDGRQVFPSPKREISTYPSGFPVNQSRTRLRMPTTQRALQSEVTVFKIFQSDQRYSAHVEVASLGKHSPPATSLHMRLKDMSKFTTPAPGNYNPLVI